MKILTRTHLGMALAVLVPLCSFGAASSALALEPTGNFARFKQCPRFTTGVNHCLYAEITGGEVAIKKTVVPINEDKKHAIILQGGYGRHEEGEKINYNFVGALNGETLSKTPQKVPGGLLDLVKCNEIKGEGFFEKLARGSCELVFENGTTGVNAITELAKPASEIKINTDNLLNEEGVALSLPTKVRLENSLLGSECYIGSSSAPVTLNLTTGTTSPPAPNKPISGSIGDLQFNEGGELIELLGDKLVDNSFAVPVASGCGGIFSFILDPIVDSKLELPSTAGNNTAIQTGNSYSALAKKVIETEK
jgi:hypothetical protein